MQKNIIALAIAAAFAAPVAALAESSFYGSMDGGIRHQTNNYASAGAGLAGGTTDTMQMGQYNTARWGFKGVDDLGDGMKATVALETSFGPQGVGSNTNISPGANAAAQATNNVNSNPFGLIFDRLAIVGVSGSMGAIDMGWNYTTAFKTMLAYDPMNYKFLGVAGAKSSGLRRLTDTSGTSKLQDRAGSVQYTNKFGDVGLTLEYDVNNGDKATQPRGGVARAVGVTYATGPVNVGVAYTTVEPSAGSTDKVVHMTAGAGFNFGDGKVSVGYAKNTIDAFAGAGMSDEKDTNMWAGVSYNVSSATAVSFAYYKNAFTSGLQAAAGAVDSSKTTMIVAATYALSKKTNLYFAMDRAVYNAGTTTAVDETTTGTSAGLNTAF